MIKRGFSVSLTPMQVMDKIKDGEDGELIYEEFHSLGEEKYYGTLIFEKYFMRVGNKGALVVLVNNINGKTVVTSVAAGTSKGMISDFDWGAAEDFADSVRTSLAENIIDELEE